MRQVQRAVWDGNDVVALLKEQHRQVKDEFTRILSQRGDQRAKSFKELRKLMNAHETAEAEIVHPFARQFLEGGDGLVDKRLEEEEHARRTMETMGGLDVDSPEFERSLHDLYFGVLAHAASEEREEFNRLARIIDEERLVELQKAFQAAESAANSRFNEEEMEALQGPRTVRPALTDDPSEPGAQYEVSFYSRTDITIRRDSQP
jgi:hemerythrin superfamily protein